MGNYLYVTLETTDGPLNTYSGIIVEDVYNDYQPVVHFHTGDFLRDFQSYVAWAEEYISRHETAEIYESSNLMDLLTRFSSETDQT